MRRLSALVVTIIITLLLTTPNIIGEGSQEQGVEGVDAITLAYTPHAPFTITGNQELSSIASTEGWPGDGTEEDPYIFEGYHVDAKFQGTGILINGTSDYFVIRNCYITNTTYDNSYAGIYLNFVNNIEVSNNTFVGSGYSISMEGCDYNLIADNEITRSNVGIWTSFVGARYNKFYRNNFHDCQRGMFMGPWVASGIPGEQVVYNEVMWNNFTDCGASITLWESNNNTVAYNTISGGDLGLHPVHTIGNEFYNNTIIGASIAAVWSMAGEEDVYKYNSIVSCGVGFDFEWCMDILVEENDIINCEGAGVFFYERNQLGRFYHNNFINNNRGGKQVVYWGAFNEGECEWDSGLPLGGNYWSDHTSIDEFSGQFQNIPGPDGFVDEPYSIEQGGEFPNGTDNFPQTNPYGWKEKRFTHSVLVEMFATTDSTGSAESAAIWVDLMEDPFLNFQLVTMVADADPDAEARSINYNINSYPTVEIDGAFEDLGEETEEAYLGGLLSSGEREVPSLDININAEYSSSGQISVSVDVTNMGNNAYRGDLRLYITEEVSRHQLDDGSNAKNGLIGTALVEVNISAGETITETGDWNGADHYDLEGKSYSDIDPNNILLVAALFDKTPHIQFHPPILNPYMAYYVDQSASTKITKGVDRPIENQATGESFDSIQEALDDADTLDGHTINIGPGTHIGNAVLKKSVDLVGAGRDETTLFGVPTLLNGDVIRVEANDVSIKGLTITGSGIYWGDSGIEVYKAQNCEITDCNISGNGYSGISIFDTTSVGIHGNVINDNIKNGIFVWESDSNTITENTIVHSEEFGLYLERSNSNTITHNKMLFHDDRVIHMGESDNNVIRMNDIAGGSVGIELKSSNGNTMVANNLIDCMTLALDKGDNIWNDPYPQGGNFWGDWTNRADEYSGSNQDQPGSDGIKDQSHYISGTSTKDLYPLAAPTGTSQYLMPGWNAISVSNIAAGTTIEDAILLPNWYYDSIQIWDAALGEWKHYNPDLPEEAGVSSLDPSMGIMLEMNRVSVHYVDGPPVTSGPITLHPGWNLVGYPFAEKTVSIALSGIQYEKIEGFDHNSGQWETMGSQDLLKTNHAYWIYSTASVIQTWNVT